MCQENTCISEREIYNCSKRNQSKKHHQIAGHIYHICTSGKGSYELSLWARWKWKPLPKTLSSGPGERQLHALARAKPEAELEEEFKAKTGWFYPYGCYVTLTEKQRDKSAGAMGCSGQGGAQVQRSSRRAQEHLSCTTPPASFASKNKDSTLLISPQPTLQCVNEGRQPL